MYVCITVCCLSVCFKQSLHKTVCQSSIPPAESRAVFLCLSRRPFAYACVPVSTHIRRSTCPVAEPSRLGMPVCLNKLNRMSRAAFVKAAPSVSTSTLGRPTRFIAAAGIIIIIISLREELKERGAHEAAAKKQDEEEEM